MWLVMSKEDGRWVSYSWATTEEVATALVQNLTKHGVEATFCYITENVWKNRS